MLENLKRLNEQMDRHNHALAEQLVKEMEQMLPRSLAGLLALVAGMFLFLIVLESADCATGGTCMFSNGDIAEWLFPKVLYIEGAFWHIVSG